MSQSTILVVEDDEAIRDALSEIVASGQQNVISAANGEVALAALEASEELPRLIFLDLMMPGLDGRGFLSRKSTNPRLRDIPVVVVTASNTEAQDGSIVGHLRKPVDIDDILGFARKFAPQPMAAT